MARGQVSKQKVAEKIVNSFEGAFLYNDGKEIRIPMEEDGEQIQIKVALTAAKENVVPGDENAIPGEQNFNVKIDGTVEGDLQLQMNGVPITTRDIEPTEEEKQNVNDLLRALGL